MTITFTIDGQEVTAEQDKTLLDVAREMGNGYSHDLLPRSDNGECSLPDLRRGGGGAESAPASLYRQGGEQHEGPDAKRESHPCTKNHFGDACIHDGSV